MAIITERGLRKHLGEKIFSGDSETSITEALFDIESIVKFGILREDDCGFYLRVCERLNVTSPAFRILDRIHRIMDGRVVAIQYPNTHLRYYYVDLSRNYKAKLIKSPDKNSRLKLL